MQNMAYTAATDPYDKRDCNYCNTCTLAIKKINAHQVSLFNFAINESRGCSGILMSD